MTEPPAARPGFHAKDVLLVQLLAHMLAELAIAPEQLRSLFADVAQSANRRGTAHGRRASGLASRLAVLLEQHPKRPQHQPDEHAGDTSELEHDPR